jgi:phenol 2-monooxygenase
MVGETSNALWGVMDVFPRTNFPDIRKKTSIRSASGNLLIIPREGGSMARFYIELAPGTIPKSVTLEDLQKTAQQIFSPFTMEFADTFWWSAYSIGQRLTEQFSQDDRIFLTGDASHTHSPKAGQGMNLSLQDGYNIGWKLGLIMNGLCSPDLLKTYTLERGKTAADLIAFDRELTSMLKVNTEQNNADALKRYSDHFIKSAKYTAGLTTRYQDSILTSAEKSEKSLATNIEVGMRFPGAQVVRLCDARAVQLSQALKSDGRFRLMAFPGDISEAPGLKLLNDLASFLVRDDSPIRAATPENRDPDSVIEIVAVLYGSRVRLEEDNITIPEVYTPITGKWRMRGKFGCTSRVAFHQRASSNSFVYRRNTSRQLSFVMIDSLL